MALSNESVYQFRVLPGTRDHKGFFVQETTYRLNQINEAGWAHICLDSAACYYVDPLSVLKLMGAGEV